MGRGMPLLITTHIAKGAGLKQQVPLSLAGCHGFRVQCTRCMDGIVMGCKGGIERTHRSHLVELLVLTLVEAIEVAGEVWDGVNDSQDLGGIHHLGSQRHPVQCDDGGDDSIEDAPLIGKQLVPAQPGCIRPQHTQAGRICGSAEVDPRVSPWQLVPEGTKTPHSGVLCA